jgi:hypothetical protein
MDAVLDRALAEEFAIELAQTSLPDDVKAALVAVVASPAPSAKAWLDAVKPALPEASRA